MIINDEILIFLSYLSFLIDWIAHNQREKNLTIIMSIILFPVRFKFQKKMSFSKCFHSLAKVVSLVSVSFHDWSKIRLNINRSTHRSRSNPFGFFFSGWIARDAPPRSQRKEEMTRAGGPVCKTGPFSGLPEYWCVAGYANERENIARAGWWRE